MIVCIVRQNWNYCFLNRVVLLSDLKQLKEAFGNEAFYGRGYPETFMSINGGKFGTRHFKITKTIALLADASTLMCTKIED